MCRTRCWASASYPHPLFLSDKQRRKEIARRRDAQIVTCKTCSHFFSERGPDHTGRVSERDMAPGLYMAGDRRGRHHGGHSAGDGGVLFFPVAWFHAGSSCEFFLVVAERRQLRIYVEGAGGLCAEARFFPSAAGHAGSGISIRNEKESAANPAGMGSDQRRSAQAGWERTPIHRDRKRWPLGEILSEHIFRRKENS